MDLMTLAAKITLDDSSYTKGIKNAENMGQQLAGKMSSMTVAVGNIMADMMRKGVQAIGGVVSGAIDGYADYQQLIGGVETLFKTSSDKVAAYAKQSFKNTGLSANEYMETVTSFSASLLQGLGGNTEAAADIANTAVQDMADNANKMGTDIGSIQAAYMGFAKQNYTMLDNLKLGYGGTASEMVRLINDSGILEEEIKDLDGITFDQLVMAIHKIQENMGITGTTAREAATTILGSAASMKAAWSDMLSAVGGEGGQERLEETMAGFKESFSLYVNTNLLPSVKNTIANTPDLISTVVEAVKTIPSKAIAQLAEGGIDILTATVDGAKELAGWLTDGLVKLFSDINADPSKIADLGNAIGEFIGSALSDIAKSAPTIISGLFTAGVTLASSLIEGLFSGLFGADEGVYKEITDANKEMYQSIEDATESSTKAKGILDYMESLVAKYGEAATETEEWAAAQAALNEVMPGATEYLEEQNESLTKALGNLKEYASELGKLAIEEAKRKALQTKQDAWVNAKAELLSTQANIEVQRSIADEARASLVDYIRNYGADKSFTGAGTSIEQLKYIAYATLGQKYENGAGDTGYTEDAKQIEGWLNTLTGSESEIEKLKGSLTGLEEQVRVAETEYLTSAAAVDKLTGSASGAAQALQAIKTPSITATTMGEYYNLYYTTQPRAIGLDFVPFNGFKAELHRGEAIITAEENARRMNGGVDAAEFAAVMEDALITAMSRVNVNMSGEKVGDLTTKQVRNNINANSYSRQRSLGG